jgi:kynurenine formamidase
MAPETYVGPAMVLGVRKRLDPARITPADLRAAWPAGATARRVLIDTG